MTTYDGIGAAIEARGLLVRLERVAALDHLDVEIARHEVTVIVGRNGAGKSTLLRTALGEHRPREGRVRVLGLDPLRERDALLRRIGFVPDVPDAPAWMTPDKLLRFLEPHYSVFDRDAARERLRVFDVPLDRRIGLMSRGQAMLTMIAAATAHDPELLLLDEPFAALDAIARRDVLRAVIGEHRADRRTIVLTTHDLEVACRIGDSIVMIDQGKVAWRREASDCTEMSTAEPVPEQIERLLAECAAR